MSIIIDQLIDDILEVVLEDMGHQTEWSHDEDGAHTSVEYNLKNEAKLKGKIEKLIEQTIEKIPKED